MMTSQVMMVDIKCHTLYVQEIVHGNMIHEEDDIVVNEFGFFNAKTGSLTSG